MRKILTLLLFVLPTLMMAQRVQPDIPSPEVLEAKQDFVEYQTLAFELMEWVCFEPWEGNEAYVDDARVFCLKWLMGTPTLTIEVDVSMNKYTKKNHTLFAPMLFGMALGSQIEGYSPKDYSLGVLYGCYIRNRSFMVRDKKIEKLDSYALTEG